MPKGQTSASPQSQIPVTSPVSLSTWMLFSREVSVVGYEGPVLVEDTRELGDEGVQRCPKALWKPGAQLDKF
jgi:hypothetical protein